MSSDLPYEAAFLAYLRDRRRNRPVVRNHRPQLAGTGENALPAVRLIRRLSPRQNRANVLPRAGHMGGLDKGHGNHLYVAVLRNSISRSSLFLPMPVASAITSG